ncbi:MAG: 1-acyl-sn-glycerol-3-phosphate acyltransferase [Myxococcales bacterium]|nr:1-acyl-sn-glycerol-3-phosphate acyltransferase [Myxococcales bacterium]
MSATGRPAESLARRLMRRVRRAGRVALVISAFAGFAGGTLLVWLVLPLVWLYGGGRDHNGRTRACQRMLARAFRVFHGYMRMMALLDARVTGEIPRRANGGPVVIIANHTTLVDVTAIAARFPNLTTIAKPGIAEGFFTRRVLSYCGHMSSGQDAIARGLCALRMSERLGQGFDVLIFPEGTRSPRGGLRPFQRGAFEIACRADVPIVLLRSTCEPSALTRDRAFWDQPDRVAILTIAPWKVLDPRDFGGDSLALQTHAEKAYKEALGLSDTPAW